MEQQEEEITNRIQGMSDEHVLLLTQFASGTEVRTVNVYRSIPRGLNIEEVQDLGNKIMNLTEWIYPSKDHASHGHKNESRFYKYLGLFAVSFGDTVTAESVITHLRSGRDIRSRLAARKLQLVLDDSLWQ